MTPDEAIKLKVATEQLREAEEHLEMAQALWAHTAREIGQAAVARELDLTPQAVYERIKAWGRMGASLH